MVGTAIAEASNAMVIVKRFLIVTCAYCERPARVRAAIVLLTNKGKVLELEALLKQERNWKIGAADKEELKGTSYLLWRLNNKEYIVQAAMSPKSLGLHSPY